MEKCRYCDKEVEIACRNTRDMDPVDGFNNKEDCKKTLDRLGGGERGYKYEDREAAKTSLMQKANSVNFETMSKKEFGNWVDKLSILEFIVLMEMHDEFKTPRNKPTPAYLDMMMY